MNTRDLQYLIALSEHRHFGKAADACFVSQPALSMQIKKLEATLGIKLLERTNKSVLLTEAGVLIAERARLILSQIDELRDLAKAIKDPLKGELKLGIIPTLAPYLLPLIMPSLTKKFPQVTFYLIEEQTTYLIEKLRSGQIDAALLASSISDTKFSSTILFTEEFLLAVPNTHSLAKQKTVKRHDLDNQTLLLLEDGHCMREQTLNFCHQSSAHEMQNFRATSLETLRHMVASGNGLTLIPQLAMRKNDGITYIPFSKEKPTRTIVLYSRNTSAKKILLEEIAKIIALH